MRSLLGLIVIVAGFEAHGAVYKSVAFGHADIHRFSLEEKVIRKKNRWILSYRHGGSANSVILPADMAKEVNTDWMKWEKKLAQNTNLAALPSCTLKYNFQMDKKPFELCLDNLSKDEKLQFRKWLADTKKLALQL